METTITHPLTGETLLVSWSAYVRAASVVDTLYHNKYKLCRQLQHTHDTDGLYRVYIDGKISKAVQRELRLIVYTAKN